MDEDEDPFGPVSSNCHVSFPQHPLLLSSAAFLRQHDRFPSDSSPAAAESTLIRLESPPPEDQEEFLTPEEYSLPTVDPSESTVVIEWGRDGLVGDAGGFKVVGRQGFKRLRVSGEGLECSGRGYVDVEPVDLGADDLFDEMPMRRREVENVALDGKVIMGNGGVEKGLDESVSTEVVDLGENELCMRNGGVESGPDENVSTEVVGLDENELCVGTGEVEKGPDESVNAEFVDLDGKDTCGDLTMRNSGVERGINENLSTEVVDLNEKQTCGDLTMRNLRGEIRTNEDESTEVVDLDENESCGHLSIRNLGGKLKANECDEVRRGIEEIGNRKFVASKNDENQQTDERIGGWRGLYDDLSKKRQETEKSLKKVDEPCREENRGSNKKGKEKNDGFQRVSEENDKFRQKGKCIGGSRKLCDDLPRRNPSRDGIRGSVKDTNFQNGDNICQKSKGPAEVRKLPSSLDMLADIALDDVSRREKNGGFVKKNRHESNKSERVGGSRDLPSTDQTKNDQIMKNLLDALGLVTEGKREKVDDGSDEEIDFLETAMIQGIVIPKPRWWPSEGFDDD